MSWHAVDDSLLERLAHLGVSVEHAYLHMEALAYCSRLHTDGELPMDLARVSRIAHPAEGAAQLWAAGLWRPHANGWEVVDYLDLQRSAEQIEEDKRRARQRAERSRRHRSGDHSMCRPSYCKDATQVSDTNLESSLSDAKAIGARDVQRTCGAGARGHNMTSPDLTGDVTRNGDRAPAAARADAEESALTAAAGMQLLRDALAESTKAKRRKQPPRKPAGGSK